MKEKERYKLVEEDFEHTIIDKEIHKIYYCDCYGFDDICDLLNQQDKRIKELGEEIKKANINNYLADYFLVEKENKQLKQQLHDLPKKIVESIRDVAGDYWDFNICEECGNVPDLNTLTIEDFDEILDTILKKYGGKNEN